MASLRKTLFAGVAAIGIGFAGATAAQTAHVMTVPVPGGGIAQLRYVGDVPPQIVFAPASAAFPAASDSWMPVFSLFGHNSPFAMLDRIAAEMDRRAAAMFRYAETIADRADAGGFAEAAFGAVPPGMQAGMQAGGQSYSYVSTVSGAGVCTQSVRITSRGDGTPPRVERHSSGNCASAAERPGIQPAAPVPAAPAKQPDLILTQGTGANRYAGTVRHVASAH